LGLRGRIFVGPWSKFTECHRARDALTKSGLSFTSVKGDVGKPVVVTIGDKKLEGFDAKQGGPKLAAALEEAGYSAAADKVKLNWFMAGGGPRDHARLRDHGLRTGGRLTRCLQTEKTGGPARAAGFFLSFCRASVRIAP